MWAAEEGLADLVTALLELSPSRRLLNMADEQRTTALHSASLLNRVEVGHGTWVYLPAITTHILS